MPQQSLTALWGGNQKKQGNQKQQQQQQHQHEKKSVRKEPPSDAVQENVKRLKNFHPGGEGDPSISKETSERVRERLADLDSIRNIKQRSKRREGPVSLKPMQLQIQKIKQEHPDTLLLVEEGYKYKIYADDALIVSRVLGFYLSDGRKHFEDDMEEGDDQYETFATCSFPVQSLQTHTKKFVELGYKVGIVQQLEQAALKQSGKLMKRGLTRKFTKATFADEFQTSDEKSVSSFLFVIKEHGSKFGVLAVEPSTGDIIYDEFGDGLMLTELETRLLHIQPCEVLIIGEPSSRLSKIVSNITQSSNEKTLIHSSEVDSGFHTAIIDKFSTDIENSSNKADISKTLEMVQKLPELVQECLSAAMTHLEEYNMAHIFTIHKNYSSFSSQKDMYLSGDTLISLEIFQNQNDHTSEGSLFALLDQTRTAYGQRLLKKWVTKPLLNSSLIDQRLEAVAEMTRPCRKSGLVAQEFVGCLDLEKCLANIYYRRSSRPQLYKFLNKLHKVVMLEDPKVFNSQYLNDLFNELPQCRGIVNKLWQQIDESWFKKWEQDRQDDVALFFNTDMLEDEDIFVKRFDLQETEQAFDAHIAEVRKFTKVPMNYSTYGDQPYVIEVDAKYRAKIPNDWIPFSKTTHKHKYRSPECERLYVLYEKNRAALKQECDRVYQEYLEQISQHYAELRDLINSLAQLDCLMSLSELARYDHYTRPTLSDQVGIQVTNGRHPTAEQALDVDYIANDITMNSTNRVKIVTGPNMGGKSSYVRQVALIAIMAQIGSFVPADEASVGPFDAVYTRMGAYDSMLRGQSTFKVELQECGTIMQKATPKSLVVLDEVGRGTSTTDGHSIAHAVLSHFITDIQCATLFITHYPALASFAAAFPNTVGCYRMGFEQVGDNQVRFTYKLERGVAAKSYGLNVARIANLPQNVLELASEKSLEMENMFTSRHASAAAVRQAEFVHKVSQQESVDYEQVIEILQSLF